MKIRVPVKAVKIISKFEVEVELFASTPIPSKSGVVIIPPPIPSMPAIIPPRNVISMILCKSLCKISKFSFLKSCETETL